MSGVFQVTRDIFNNDIWQNPAEFRLFLYILGNAVWKEEGVRYGDILVKRGQYLRSYRNLREDLMYMDNNAIKHYSLSRIKKMVDNLIKDERLKKEETKLGTLFTVVNYSKYQWDNNYKEEAENAERTQKERRKNNKNKDNKDNNIYSAFFEEVWKMYPSKKGKGKVSDTTKKKIYKLGDEFKRCIERYLNDLEKDKSWRKPQNGSTFFNSGYIDYLDENYIEKQIEAEDDDWRGTSRRLD